MTNREWLESLSDERFVEAINSAIECDECELIGCCDSVLCDERFVKWLRAKHEGDSISKIDTTALPCKLVLPLWLGDMHLVVYRKDDGQVAVKAFAMEDAANAFFEKLKGQPQDTIVLPYKELKVFPNTCTRWNVVYRGEDGTIYHEYFTDEPKADAFIEQLKLDKLKLQGE